MTNMTGMWRRLAAAALVATSAGCAGDDAEHPDAPPIDDRPAVTARSSPPPSPAEWEALQQRIQAYADSVDSQLRQVSGLSLNERRQLRRDVNDPQVARARQLGIRRGADAEAMVKADKLVRLPDTTQHWIVRELDYSSPYVTPSAEAMLVEIAERFHTRLDSLRVPRFRLDITSVLRTPQDQAKLRRRNSNAANQESAHEFGTTVDVAYRRYAPPEIELDTLHPQLQGPARQLLDSLMEETARERGAELQAVLGRVIAEMRSEGKLLVMMERSQTVFHMTVARRLSRKRSRSSGRRWRRRLRRPAGR